MRSALLLFVASISTGCTDEEGDAGSRTMPVLLAGIEGKPTVVGTVQHGALQLDDAFASSFDVTLSLDADSEALSRTFAEGDLVNLLVIDGSDVVDAIPLVVGSQVALVDAIGLVSCPWEFRTTRYGDACTTLTYWKRCGGNAWERYGESTWCE